MMNKIWSDEAWEDYLYWQMQDKKTLKRINQLIKDIDRDRYDGIGKPEPLGGKSFGFLEQRHRWDKQARLSRKESKY